MAYLGYKPDTSFRKVNKQTITGNGGASYTLTYPVNSSGELEVFVNNVRQEPDVAYTALGTTLTMTGNVLSTDSFYVVYQAQAIGTLRIPEKDTINGSYNFNSVANANVYVTDGTTTAAVGIFGANAYVGSLTTSAALRFKTAGVDRVRISGSSGYFYSYYPMEVQTEAGQNADFYLNALGTRRWLMTASTSSGAYSIYDSTSSNTRFNISGTTGSARFFTASGNTTHEFSSDSNGNYFSLKNPAGNEAALLFADTNSGILGNHNNFYVINSSSVANIIFQNGTSYTERMRIDANGNVGIGLTNPQSKLEVLGAITILRQTSSTGYTSLRLYNDQNLSNRSLEIDYFGSAYSGGERAEIATTGAYPLAFLTNNTERMRIDASGNVGIGITATAKLHIKGISNSGSITNISDFSGLRIDGSLSNSGTTGIVFQDGGGGGASVGFYRGPGYDTGITFYTNSSGTTVAGAMTERMRIDPSGRLLVGTNSIGSHTSTLYVNGTLGAQGLLGRQGASGTSNGNNFNFWWTGSLTQLWVDNTNTGTINTSSDYRIKRNIETSTNPALTRLLQLRPITYQFANYKQLYKEEEFVREGFLAHEVAEIIPSAVEGEKDDPNQIQSLRLDALCSVMVKAIQEQQTIIDGLTARLEALESK